MRFHQAISLHPNGQRIFAQTAKLGAKPIADDAINHKCSIDLARSSENFSARQISPFVRTDNAAGLQPVIIRIQIRDQIGSRRVLARTCFARRTMSTTLMLMRSTLRKSARIPSSMIWRLIFTM